MRPAGVLSARLFCDRPALRAAVAAIGLTMAAAASPSIGRAEPVDFSREIQQRLA